MTDLRLVIFDVDGTLVDSQADIVACMGAAFTALGAASPSRQQVLSIVGLSLPQAMAVLAPQMGARDVDRLADEYRRAYAARRQVAGADVSSPLYPGARQVLEQLHARDDVILGIATGKSARGLDHLIEAHGLEGMFVTRQVADHHPSKPHPSMLHAALSATGCNPDQAVMIGDTTFDMDMARAAQVRALGVAWGYHGAERLGTLQPVAKKMADLPMMIDAVLGESA